MALEPRQGFSRRSCANYVHGVQVKQFMRDRKFPTLLRGRVRQYFSYYLAKKSLFDEQVPICRRVWLCRYVPPPPASLPCI